jgi:hypothetical protein
MADQKSRGGQKRGKEKEPQGKKDRDVRAGGNETKEGRDMAEDAQRGQQGNQGGYQSQQNPDRNDG